MKNIAVREAIRNARLFNYEVAAALGISETSFSRKLRHELPEKETGKILGIIAQLAEEVKSNET